MFTACVPARPTSEPSGETPQQGRVDAGTGAACVPARIEMLGCSAPGQGGPGSAEQPFDPADGSVGGVAGEADAGAVDVEIGVRSECSEPAAAGPWETNEAADAERQAALSSAVPWVLRESYETLREPGHAARWYSYAVLEDDLVCDVVYAGGLFSRPGCLAYLDRQPWSSVGQVGGFLRSRGPWWVDPNHRIPDPAYSTISLPNPDPGLGYVHVIAFTQPRAALHEPVDLTGGELRFKMRVSADFEALLAPSRVGDRRGHVYFWFQTSPRALGAPCVPDNRDGENCTRQSDYIMADPQLTDARFQLDAQGTRGAWRDVTLKLWPEPNQWTCLGRGDNVKYDCLPIDQALQQVEHVGFLLAPVCTAPDPSASESVFTCGDGSVAYDRIASGGTIDVDDFALSVPARERVLWEPPEPSAGAGQPWIGAQTSTALALGDQVELRITAAAAEESRVVGLIARGETEDRDLHIGLRLDPDGRVAFYEQGMLHQPATGHDRFAPGDTFRITMNQRGSELHVAYYRGSTRIGHFTQLCCEGQCAARFQATALRTSPAPLADRTVLLAPYRALVHTVAWQELPANLLAHGDSLLHTMEGPAEADARALLTPQSSLELSVGSAMDVSQLALLPQDAALCPSGHTLAFGAGQLTLTECDSPAPLTDLAPLDPRQRFRFELVGADDGTHQLRILRNEGAGFALLHEGAFPGASASVRVSFGKPGSAFTHLTLHDARILLEWDDEHLEGLSATPAQLTRTRDGYGWEVGSVSRQHLLAGDGFVEFRVRDNTSGKRIGFGGHAGAQGVLHELYLPDVRWNADAAVYDHTTGAEALTVGSYAAGDLFRVGIEGGKVSYRRNGELLYQSAQPLADDAYPLWVSASLFSAGAEIYDVTLSDGFVSE